MERNLTEMVKDELKNHNKTVMKYLNKDYIMCTICCERERSRVVFPCTHFHYCEKCILTVREKEECLTCKSKIIGDIKVAF